MEDEKRNRAKELMKELDSIDEQIFENESILKEVLKIYWLNYVKNA